MKNTYSGEVVKGNVCHVFKMDDGKHYLGLSGIDPDAYPIGTRITVTLEEPEPDWSRYECVLAWRRHENSSVRWQFERRNFPNHMDKEIVYAYFHNAKYISDVNMAFIEGRLPDGSVEIIDRWEKEEKGK